MTERVRERRLHVFVSSPDECAQERGIARAVVERVSSSDDCRRKRLSLVPLMWEDLPGGEVEGGDAMSRLNAVLRRSGLGHYEIYVGFFRTRLGTRTQRARSGTVEELEDARRGHRRRGRPSEVLLYLLGPASARSRELSDYVGELRDGRSRLLHHEVLDAADFERRLELHLRHVVEHWSSWRRRLARQRRNLRVAGAAVGTTMAALSAFFFVRFDRGGRNAVLDAIAAGHVPRALDAYERSAPWMLVHRGSARVAVNAFAAEAIRASDELATGLSWFEDWSRRDARDEALVGSTREELRGRVRDALDVASLGLEPGTAVRLLRRASAAGVSGNEPYERASALRGAAAAAWLNASARIARERALAELWGNVLARPALAELARGGARSGVDLVGRADRTRARLLAEALDMETLRRVADRALAEPEYSELPEVRAFLARAPAEVAAEWLRASVRPEIEGWRFAKMVEAVRARGDANLALVLLDLTTAGRAPYEFLDTDTESFLGLERGRAGLGDALMVRLLEWVETDTLPDDSILAMVVPLLDPRAVPEERASAVATRLSAIASDPERFQAEPELLEFLSGVDVPEARAFVDGVWDEYLGGRVHGGIAQRAALLRGLRAGSAPDLERARALSLATFAACTDSAGRETDDHDRVQAEYVGLLAQHARGELGLHAELLRRIVDRRAARPSPSLLDLAAPSVRYFWQETFDASMRALVASLSDAQLSELFGFEAWEPIAQFDGRWDRTRYGIEVLYAGERAWSGDLARKVWEALPASLEDSHAERLAVAQRGGAALHETLRRILAASSTRWWAYVAASGDLESMAWLEEHLRDPASIEALLDASVHLPEADRTALLARVVEHTASVPQLDQLLIYHASSTRFERLVASACDVLATSTSREDLPRCIEYLCRTDRGALAATLGRAGVLERLRETLGGFDQFWWVQSAQSFSWPEGEPLPAPVIELARARRLVVALGPGSGPMTADELVLETGAEPRTLLSPLLELCARSAGPDARAALLEAATSNEPVECNEPIPNLALAFRGYVHGLLAAHVQRFPDIGFELDLGARLVDDLSSDDPLLASSAALVVLAATRATESGADDGVAR